MRCTTYHSWLFVRWFISFHKGRPSVSSMKGGSKGSTEAPLLYLERASVVAVGQKLPGLVSQLGNFLRKLSFGGERLLKEFVPCVQSQKAVCPAQSFWWTFGCKLGGQVQSWRKVSFVCLGFSFFGGGSSFTGVNAPKLHMWLLNVF